MNKFTTYPLVRFSGHKRMPIVGVVNCIASLKSAMNSLFILSHLLFVLKSKEAAKHYLHSLFSSLEDLSELVFFKFKSQTTITPPMPLPLQF